MDNKDQLNKILAEIETFKHKEPDLFNAGLACADGILRRAYYASKAPDDEIYYSVSMIFDNGVTTTLSNRILKASSEEEAFGLAYKDVTSVKCKNFALKQRVVVPFKIKNNEIIQS